MTASENPNDINSLPKRECKSCQYEYEGNFCPRCGQRYLEGRFTLKQSLSWVFGQVFNLDRGILYTTKELLLRPGSTIKDYLGLSTVKYMHPFRYVFVLATVSAILTVLSIKFVVPVEDISSYQYVDAGEMDEKQLRFMERWMDLLQKYLAFIIMISIPFNGLSSLIVYKKRKLNYTEHLILNAYGYGLTIAFAIPAYLLMFLPKGIYINSVASFVIYFGLLGWVFANFFKETLVEGILKVILITIMTIVMAFIAGIILVVPAAIIYVKLFKG